MKVVSRRSATLLVGVAAAAVAVMVVASGATARTAQTGRVCVLLPDTTTSVRWQQFDAPAFKNAFKKAGVSGDGRERARSAAEDARAGRAVHLGGAKVGIITDIDRGTSIAIQKKFSAVGGKTIDYDRQIIGGTGSVYISFDGNPTWDASRRSASSQA